MPKGNHNPSPSTRIFGPGPGRPKGVKNKITRARVEQELRYVAFSRMGDFFVRTDKFSRLYRLRTMGELSEGAQRAMSSIKVRTENLAAGDDKQDSTVEIRLWDKVKALELCAKALGMLTMKHEHTVPEELLGRLDRAKVRSLGKK